MSQINPFEQYLRQSDHNEKLAKRLISRAGNGKLDSVERAGAVLGLEIFLKVITGECGDWIPLCDEISNAITGVPSSVIQHLRGDQEL